MAHLRDASIVVIETSRTSIKAGLGLHDLLKTPSVDIKARVGIRKTLCSVNDEDSMNVDGAGMKSGPKNAHASMSSSTSASASRSCLLCHPNSSARVHDYLVGAQLDQALKDGQDILVSWPFADGDVSDWTQAEALWKYVLFKALSLRRSQNESPVFLALPPGPLSRQTLERTSQIFFERFNVAAFSVLFRSMAQIYAANSLNGIVVDIGWEMTDVTPVYYGFPVQGARVTTQIGLRDCLNYLAHQLRSNTSVMSTLIPPAAASLSDKEIHAALLGLAQDIYEAGLIKAPASASNALDALLGEDEGVTDIASILVAGKEKAVIETASKKKAALKAAAAGAAERDKAKEAEAMDLVTIEWKVPYSTDDDGNEQEEDNAETTVVPIEGKEENGAAPEAESNESKKTSRAKEVTIGRERHRFCDPLFDPSLLIGLQPYPEPGASEAEQRDLKFVWPLQEAIGFSMRLCEVDQRQYMWQGLFVTGEITGFVRGLGIALQPRLSSFILINADLQPANEVQPRSIKAINVPEYFAEYREKGESLAAFLGASIVAKISFQDPNGRNFVSKNEYSEKGPKAVVEMSPSLM